MSDSVNVISDKMLALVHDATRAAYDFAIAIELRHNVKAAMLADERSLRALAEAIAAFETEISKLKAENAKLKAEIEQRADHESYLSQEFANTYYEKNARIAELEAENERLSQLLHDEMSQLEIATDLGNKRWTALNKIYEDGEKHNANWCKRMAQEGLGIKNA